MHSRIGSPWTGGRSFATRRSASRGADPGAADPVRARSLRPAGDARGALGQPADRAARRPGLRRLPQQPDSWPWYTNVAPVSWLVQRDSTRAAASSTSRSGTSRSRTSASWSTGPERRDAAAPVQADPRRRPALGLGEERPGQGLVRTYQQDPPAGIRSGGG